MDEFDFIREKLAPLSAGAPGALGLGDDAARVAPPAGFELVVTADTVIAGVHFPVRADPSLIAKKALRVNLSDLAAKSAEPVGFLMCLSLPRDIDESWLQGFTAGLGDDVRAFAVPLIGGDTTTTPGPLTISITAIGKVPAGKMLTRAGAKAGDALCVTGTIGDAALGLILSERGQQIDISQADRVFAGDRYALPQPRLKFGAALRDIATACLDISDGLIADVGHICEQSRVGATIQRVQIPLSPAMRFAVQTNPRLWTCVLGGGDDYELAFAIPPPRIAELQQIAKAAEVDFSVIGAITTGNGVNVVDEAGKNVPVLQPGYRHF